MIENFSSEMMSEDNIVNLYKALKEKKVCQSGIVYLVEISFKTEGERQTSSNKNLSPADMSYRKG